MFYSAIDAVNPYNIVMQHGTLLKQDPFVANHAKVYAVSFGKAAYAMSGALEDTLGASITKGIATTPVDLLGQTPLKHFNLYLANHPIHDERGAAATQKIVELLQGADEETLVIFLISGGGSALLIAPYGFVDLEAERRVTEILLKAGADTRQINTVRKHISAVKGGRLAEIAYPAGIIPLILSDAPGDDIDIIASGPTAPDSSTYSDALSAIGILDLLKETPAAVMKTLADGEAGILPETPKLQDGISDKVKNIIVGNNTTAIEAVHTKAPSPGYTVMETPEPVTENVRKTAKELAKRALDVHVNMKNSEKGPVCLISGGETTVTASGSGKGGRNAEFALAFALEIDGIPNISLLSAGTDGIDGPTDAAGAFADGSTVRRARKKGLNPRSFLDDNDNYSFFDKLGGLFMTGPTGTNVMDLQIIAVE